MKQESLYIVLTRTTTLLSKLIYRLTGDIYTHASIAMNRELSEMYSFGRRQPNNPLAGGFCRENLNEGVFADSDMLPFAIIEVKVTAMQYDKARAIIDSYLQNQEDYGYNYAGLFAAWFGKVYKCSNRSYCSEFVYDLLQKCGVVGARYNCVRPQDLSKLGSMIDHGDWKCAKAGINARAEYSGVYAKPYTV